MPILTIDRTPRVHHFEFLMAWGDLPLEEQFPIRIARKHIRDRWQVLWREDVVIAAFESRREMIRAAAEAACLAGADELLIE